MEEWIKGLLLQIVGFVLYGWGMIFIVCQGNVFGWLFVILGGAFLGLGNYELSKKQKETEK